MPLFARAAFSLLARPLWSAPLARAQRSGFEVTGYALSQAKLSSTWATPTARAQRSGFEVTGYALATA